MKRMILAMLAIVAMAACTSEMDTNAPTAARMPLTLGLDEIVTRSNTTEKTAFDVGDEIMVDVKEQSTVIAEFAKFKYNGTAFTSADDTIYIEKGKTYSVVAKYPYAANQAALDKLLDIADQSAGLAKDVLRSEIDDLTTSSTGNAKKLSFKHKFAKVSFTIKPGTGMTDDDLKGLTVKLTNTKLKTNSTGGTVSGDVTFYTAADGKSSAAMINPAYNYDKHKPASAFTFTTAASSSVGAKTFTMEVPPLLEKPTDLGQHCKYTVTLNRSSVTLTSSNITNWTDEGDKDLEAKKQKGDTD